MADSVFGSLLQARWRDIAAPYIALDDEGSNDLVAHKFMDRHGARQENTGGNPGVWTFQWVLVNGLSRGPQETWQDDLYPTVYGKFLTACEDRSTGPLVHPERGTIKVKAQSWKSSLTSEYRGGRILTVVYHESTEDDLELGNPADNNSLVAAAKALEADLAGLSGGLSLKGPPGSSGSLSDFCEGIAGVGSSVVALGTNAVGKIQHAIGTVTKVAESFGAIGDTLSTGFRMSGDKFTSTNQGVPVVPAELDESTGVRLPEEELGPRNARILQNCNRMLVALYKAQAKLLAPDTTIGVHEVLETATLGAIGSRLGNSIDEMIVLNQDRLSKPRIQRGTSVRYFLKT